MVAAKVKYAPALPALGAAAAQAPAAAGVYLFRDAGGGVLYVGKAVKLKPRLASYLRAPTGHDAKTASLLKKVARVDFVLTRTGKEALLLERQLIREHRPRYNVLLRDDKNFLCLRLDVQEEFPGLRFVRRFRPDQALYFGPYASAAMARETLKVMKQAFGLRTCRERRLMPRSRPCLEYQLGQCLGPCASRVDAAAYRQAVQEAVLFLKGRARNLLRDLTARMRQAAARQDYERAARLRDRITAIRRTLEGQAVAAPHFRDQDVVGLAREGQRALVVVLTVRSGLVSGSQEYYFPEVLAGEGLLGDFLQQYYTEGRPLPDEILLPEDPADRRLLQEVLSEQKGSPGRLICAGGRAMDFGGGGLGRGAPAPSPKPPPPTPTPYRGLGGEVEGRAGEPCSPGPPLKIASRQSPRARLLGLAAENARDALRRRLAGPLPADALADLQARLNLPGPPARLECLDISTLQGKQPVGALVAFTDGVPDKSGYRRFRIREAAAPDDYAMLREVVRRHYGRKDARLPDLLVVDGGKGQLKVVQQALAEPGLKGLAVAALAKAGLQEGRPVRDRLYLPGRKNPLFPPASSPGWLLLLRLRDEAHRFAVAYHRRRTRKELTASALTQVPGIGPVRQKLLLKRFADLGELRQASLAELTALPGMTRKAAQAVLDWLSGESSGPAGRQSAPG
jgi:excinuclease ABC subunit C